METKTLKLVKSQNCEKIGKLGILIKIPKRGHYNLFVDFVFGKYVRVNVVEALGINFIWQEKCLEDNFTEWIKIGSMSIYLPLFCNWANG